MAAEIYPMPMFPRLEVADVEASATWYEALGFEHVFTMPGPGGRPTLVHLRWAKYADVLLSQATDPSEGPKGRGVSLTFTLRDDAAASVAERARALGSRILVEPTLQPWNVRDVTIADPDGYRLVFSFGPIRAGATIEDVVRRVAEGPARVDGSPTGS